MKKDSCGSYDAGSDCLGHLQAYLQVQWLRGLARVSLKTDIDGTAVMQGAW